jgi:hypothetical protein
MSLFDALAILFHGQSVKTALLNHTRLPAQGLTIVVAVYMRAHQGNDVKQL